MGGFPVSKLWEDDRTITLKWLPQPDAHGYHFYVDGVRVARTFDRTRDTVRVNKGGSYRIVPLVEDEGGIWPETTPALDVPAYVCRLATNQTDPDSGPGNKYTFGWVKSQRTLRNGPRHWVHEGVVEFLDYPEAMVMVESKRFDQGYPGRTTNFHLVGGDEVHDGVSPLSADLRPGRSRDWPSDLQPGLVVTCQAELDDHRRGHWQLASLDEINADRTAVWTLVWSIRWSQSRMGYANVQVWRNGRFVRMVSTGVIKTAYAEQKPRVFVWVGGYESAGLSSPAQITQTLDYRGRTLDEALADRPILGQKLTSVGQGGPASSVTQTGTLPLSVSSP